MMTMAELIAGRLHQMFVQIADDIGTGEIALDLTEDEAAGVPFALFSAEQAMRSAFECFVSAP